MQPKKSGQATPTLPLKVLTSLALMVVLVAGPVSAFAQTTPGARPPLALAPATLNALSLNDNRLSLSPPPSGVALNGALAAYVAATTGPANIPAGSLGVDPAKLGVFALQGSLNQGAGLQLTVILNRGILASASVWVRVPATYNTVTKNLSFSAIKGTVYGVFVMENSPQSSLPDSGGPTTIAKVENDHSWLTFVLIGIYLSGVLLTVFILLRRRRSHQTKKDRLRVNSQTKGRNSTKVDSNL